MQTHEILNTVRDLVAMAPRATGTPGGEQAARYVAERFRAAGLSDVHFLEVPSYAWTWSRCEVSVTGTSGSTRVDSSPVLHSAMPSHDAVGAMCSDPVTAPVVDIGDGRARDHDVRGKVVLFDLAFTMTTAHLLPLTEWMHDPRRDLLRREVLAARNPYITTLTRTMREAAAGGAVAVVGVLRDYVESVKYHNEYFRRTLMELPGAWVTRDGGARLRAALAADPEATLTLDLVAERSQVPSRSVLGVLPGRTSETVMVQSHHDSVGPGAVEDGTGVAEVVALAEHFAARARGGEPLEKTLLFATFDTHFTGYQSHMEFCRRHLLDDDSRWQVAAVVAIEHVGLRAVRGADGGFEVLDETEPRGIFENVSPRLKWLLARGLKKHGLTSTTLLNATPTELTRVGIPTDASFFLLSGVPVVSLISGPLYLYDEADTLDKVDVAQLLPVAEYFAEVIEHLDATPAGRIGLIPRTVRRMLPRGRW